MAGVVDRHYWRAGSRSNRGLGKRGFGRRRPLLWALLAVMVVAAGTLAVFAYAHAHESAATAPIGTASTLPADRFVQSIITDDGALGWHQLCPELQATLPIDQLTQQADAARTAAAQQGIRLTAQFESAHPRQGGGEQRLYLVTAHWANGATQQRTFAILTQKSGCVEDVGYQ